MAQHKYYDPEDVKALRTELLLAGLAIMRNKAEVKRWSAIKKEYVLKVGSRVLPVLNAGRDDDKDLFPDPILGGKSNGKLPEHNSDKETVESQKKDSGR